MQRTFIRSVMGTQIGRAAFPTYRAHLLTRASATRNASTSQFPESIMEHRLLNSPLFKKLNEHPAVLSALADLVQTMVNKGINVGQQPSLQEMWRIMRDEEIKKAINNVNDKIKESGIEIDLQDVLRLSQAMQGPAQSGRGGSGTPS